VLSSEQIGAFFDEGYIVIPELFSPGEVAEISAAFDRLEETAQTLRETTMYRGSYFVLEPYQDPAGDAEHIRIHRLVWCGAAERRLLDLGRHPRLLRVVEALLDSPEMDHIINQAHFKLPGDGVAFDWHQDCLHRRMGTDLWTDANGLGSFVQTLVAVDPMTLENGPIQVVPGSCQEGAITVDPVTRALPHDAFDMADAIPVLMKPGSALVMGPYTIHGSHPNDSAMPRRLFINGFAYPGANRRDYPGDGAGTRIVIP
jgi:ectoine hydroxylase-related dioxygenase (phytanoyl-CoA dioxygenase family)